MRAGSTNGSSAPPPAHAPSTYTSLDPPTGSSLKLDVETKDADQPSPKPSRNCRPRPQRPAGGARSPTRSNTLIPHTGPLHRADSDSERPGIVQRTLVRCPQSKVQRPRLGACRSRVRVVDQSGSETRTSCAGLSRIDERGASQGIRITDASHLIRMRSRDAGGGGSGISSRPRQRVLAPSVLSVLPVSPKWPPRDVMCRLA
jgi:hypothetical protein